MATCEDFGLYSGAFGNPTDCYSSAFDSSHNNGVNVTLNINDAEALAKYSSALKFNTPSHFPELTSKINSYLNQFVGKTSCPDCAFSVNVDSNIPAPVIPAQPVIQSIPMDTVQPKTTVTSSTFNYKSLLLPALLVGAILFLGQK